MKTPMPEPSHYVYTTEDDAAKGEGCYTESQLRAVMVAAYNEAIDEAIDMIAFNGGTVQLEAHVRQLKEQP